MSKNRRKTYRESFFNLHFTSTISVSLVLFIVGIIASLYLTTNHISRKNRENISVSLILSDTISQKDLHRIERYLNAAPWASRVEYISRDSALQEHINAIGEDPTTFLGYNPLNASFEVYLSADYASVDSINNVVKPKVAIFNGITEVAYQEDIVRLLSRNINRLSIIFTLMAGVLLFISIVLINNTIRLSIYSKRFLINTMQLVGAKNSFIRRPFILRSMMNALISTLISTTMLVGVIHLIQMQTGTSFSMIRFEILAPSIVLISIISVIINYISTVMAVNRYLRMRTSQLYFV